MAKKKNPAAVKPLTVDETEKQTGEFLNYVQAEIDGTVANILGDYEERLAAAPPDYKGTLIDETIRQKVEGYENSLFEHCYNEPDGENFEKYKNLALLLTPLKEIFSALIEKQNFEKRVSEIVIDGLAVGAATVKLLQLKNAEKSQKTNLAKTGRKKEGEYQMGLRVFDVGLLCSMFWEMEPNGPFKTRHKTKKEYCEAFCKKIGFTHESGKVVKNASLPLSKYNDAGKLLTVIHHLKDSTLSEEIREKAVQRIRQHIASLSAAKVPD